MGASETRGAPKSKATSTLIPILLLLGCRILMFKGDREVPRAPFVWRCGSRGEMCSARER